VHQTLINSEWHAIVKGLIIIKGAMQILFSSSILRHIRRQKRLTKGEETKLVRRVQSGDRAAATPLFLSHIRFVMFVARKYRRFGHPINELLQEGTVGFMEAVKRFNPDRGVRLSTYAMWWIRASIQDYVIRSRSMVKIGTSSAQKSIFFHLTRLSGLPNNYGSPKGDNITSLARSFNVTVSEVLALARRIAKPDQSLNVPASSETASISLLENLPDYAPSPEEVLVSTTEQKFWRKKLCSALSCLPPREFAIIHRRFFSDKIPSREVLGIELGISKERVRQLELRALNRLREIINSLAGEGKATADGNLKYC